MKGGSSPGKASASATSDASSRSGAESTSAYAASSASASSAATTASAVSATSATAASKPKKSERSATAAKRKNSGRNYQRDPNAPKRFKSSYIYFSNARREEIKKEMPKGTNMTSIIKAIAKEWRQLDAAAKHKWKMTAEQDRIRYQEEMKNFTGPVNVPRKRKSRREDGAPKRPMPAFMHFSRAMRRDHREEYKHTDNMEISKVLAEKWSKLTAEEKGPYMVMEREDNERYRKSMAKWVESKERERRREAYRKKAERELINQILQNVTAPLDKETLPGSQIYPAAILGEGADVHDPAELNEDLEEFVDHSENLFVASTMSGMPGMPMSLGLPALGAEGEAMDMDMTPRKRSRLMAGSATSSMSNTSLGETTSETSSDGVADAGARSTCSEEEGDNVGWGDRKLPGKRPKGEGTAAERSRRLNAVCRIFPRYSRFLSQVTESAQGSTDSSSKGSLGNGSSGSACPSSSGSGSDEKAMGVRGRGDSSQSETSSSNENEERESTASNASESDPSWPDLSMSFQSAEAAGRHGNDNDEGYMSSVGSNVGNSPSEQESDASTSA